MAADLVRLKMDVIVTLSTPAAVAAKQANTRFPSSSLSPIPGSGLVASLARPGGNVTGIDDCAGACGQTPGAAQAGGIEGEPDRGPREPAGLTERTRRNIREETEAAGRALGVNLQFFEVNGPEDFERAFAAMVEARAGALVVSPTPKLFEARGQIVAHAAKSRLPTVYAWRDAVEAGGLRPYATNFPEMYRRAAIYVDKILKGAADLPIEQPTRFELVINLAAKALGLSIPESLLQRADEVIR